MIDSDRVIRFREQIPDSRALRIFAFSAGSNLTAQQSLVNIMRVTINALAAVLRGVQTLHGSAYDEALSVPIEDAATLAPAQPAGDPRGDCWTDQRGRLAGRLVRDRDVDGRDRAQGPRRARRVRRAGRRARLHRMGWFKQKIGESAYRIQSEIDSGARRVIGANCYVVEESGRGRARCSACGACGRRAIQPPCAQPSDASRRLPAPGSPSSRPPSRRCVPTPLSAR